MPVSPPPHATQVFHGRLFDVHQWEQPLYDGSTSIFECVVRPDTVAVIPFLDASTVLITKQEQPHRTKAFFDVPGGRVDPGETFDQAVRRECEEETQMRAQEWLLWHTDNHKGCTRFSEGLFLAAQLTPSPDPMHQDPGEKIKLIRMTWNELVALCLRGELRRNEVALHIIRMAYDPLAQKRLHTFLARVF